jgi:hypothetical protein
MNCFVKTQKLEIDLCDNKIVFDKIIVFSQLLGLRYLYPSHF